MKILIVDDEKMALEDIKFAVQQALTILHQSSAEITATTSWKEALELAETTAFDIAFLDISMPGKNGLDLGRSFPT